MGLTPGDDFETGIPCPRCFDPSNPIGQQVTPKHVQLVVAGVISCPGFPAPPNGTWLLTQQFACYWSFVNAAYNMAWTSSFLFGANWISVVQIVDVISVRRYFDDRPVECSTEFENDYGPADCGVGRAGHSGTAIVSWGPGIGP